MVISTNVAPTVTTSTGTTSFTENDSPVTIDSGLTAGDSDDTKLANAKVSITGNFKSDQDVLNFTKNVSTMGNIDGSYNASTGVLNLTSSDSSATLSEW